MTGLSVELTQILEALLCCLAVAMVGGWVWWRRNGSWRGGCPPTSNTSPHPPHPPPPTCNLHHRLDHRHQHGRNSGDPPPTQLTEPPPLPPQPPPSHGIYRSFRSPEKAIGKYPNFCCVGSFSLCGSDFHSMERSVLDFWFFFSVSCSFGFYAVRCIVFFLNYCSGLARLGVLDKDERTK